ncbi:hypothetical protein OAU29_02845 [Porticoccaceae bacterium]|nr:hypothetical protein [Porticoccaceae bacterium]
MSPLKVVRLLAVVIAVIGAFTAIPEAALIMVLLGLALGFLSDQADKDNRTFYLIFALALSAMSGAAGGLPVIGGHITAILGNMSEIINAGAVAIIIMVIKDRSRFVRQQHFPKFNRYTAVMECHSSPNCVRASSKGVEYRQLPDEFSHDVIIR